MLGIALFLQEKERKQAFFILLLTSDLWGIFLWIIIVLIELKECEGC